MEIWKDVVGFEGCYKVSNLGQVKSLERLVLNNGGLQRRQEKILKAHKDVRGYLSVVLCKDGKTFPRTIHRLVAEAFIPNPENKPIVDHLDTNPANNRVDNLRWTTQQENCMNPLTRVNNSNSKKGHPGHKVNYTEEAREKMRKARLGKKLSEETKAKISKSRKGIKHSSETIERIAQAHKGVPRSEKTKKKLSEAHKGKLKGKHWKIEGGKRQWY